MGYKIEEVLLRLLFLYGFLGYIKMEFECSQYLVGVTLVVPISDITCKDVVMGNVDDNNINELDCCGGCS